MIGNDWRLRCHELLEFSRLHVDVQDPEVEYKILADKLAHAIDAQAVSIYLLSHARDSFTRVAFSGHYTPYMHECHVRTLDVGRSRRFLESPVPMVVDFISPEPEDSPLEAQRAKMGGYQCAISIPFHFYDEILGYASAAFEGPRRWTAEDFEYFMLVGQSMASYIKHTQRVERSIEYQVLEERTRISREVHDNLSQLACALKVAAERLVMKMEDDDPVVRDDLDYLVDISKDTVRALRDEMLFLRIPLSEADEGFIEGCRECLDNFEKRWDVKTNFEVDAQPGIHVSSEAATHLTRILKECISNVIRHAEASRVDVALVNHQDELVLSVSDDGKGFEPDKVPDGHLGIQLMGERVNQLHGRLVIDSAAGEGTTVSVVVKR